MKYIVKNKLVSVFMKQKSSSQSNIQNGIIVPGPGVTRAAAGWRVQKLLYPRTRLLSYQVYLQTKCTADMSATMFD